MAVFFLIIVIGLLVVLGLASFVRNERVRVHSIDDLNGRTRPVDLEALRNLLDSSQLKYLEAHVSGAQFRRLERMRTKALLEYVHRMAHNATVLVRLGAAARRSSDPQIAAAAQTLMSQAVRARLSAFSSLARLYVELLAPGLTGNVGEVFAQYQKLTESASLFTRLQQPTRTSRILALL